MLIDLKICCQKNRIGKISDDPALCNQMNQNQKITGSLSNVFGAPLITQINTEEYLKIIQADW
jgi:hypothetical protein